MNHSFNVEIAKKYGIEKAVLLDFFYNSLTDKNQDNKTLRNGKTYLVYSVDVLSQLFPYIKKKKIAQLLREMENKDSLLLSGQFHKYDRTKSYTFTDTAFNLFK